MSDHPASSPSVERSPHPPHEAVASNNNSSSGGTSDERRKRTKDIQIDHDVDFSELLLSPPILKGLNEAGYPSIM